MKGGAEKRRVATDNKPYNVEMRHAHNRNVAKHNKIRNIIFHLLNKIQYFKSICTPFLRRMPIYNTQYHLIPSV